MPWRRGARRSCCRFLPKDDTFEQLGCRFGIGTETTRRYVNDSIDALAAPAPSLADALAASGEEWRLLLNGALMSAWRCTGLATEANPDSLHQAKHREHGMNVQALTTTALARLRARRAALLNPISHRWRPGDAAL
ncbi:hypothetical protein [Streptomyces sp. Isolate_219]|uniref:hypothetical protein n=1 Tax=Streptomyces sp. Isolate_219 TaxID=2950110 RepID=UPI0021C5CB1D|nr:hypothetical protein [Streptomyces sp. Isolate_219]MCR8573696.1 hypothetical protein [Streptomyces sp. Isolate_219]